MGLRKSPVQLLKGSLTLEVEADMEVLRKILGALSLASAQDEQQPVAIA